MEAWDAGVAGGEELDEDHQPPHTQNTISLVCQTCQTRLINICVQYSTNMYLLSNTLNRLYKCSFLMY